jgi:alpha-D-xyloside xylohydrolase
MFGPSFLIKPVMKAMLQPAPEYGELGNDEFNENGLVEVYLPEGVDWYDFWTNEKFSGGQTVTVHSPIDHMPIFVKAGSIVPVGPVKNHVNELNPSPISLSIYRGGDASFTIYDDDGETYGYEEGEYATRILTWNDQQSELLQLRSHEHGNSLDQDLPYEII